MESAAALKGPFFWTMRAVATIRGNDGVVARWCNASLVILRLKATSDVVAVMMLWYFPFFILRPHTAKADCFFFGVTHMAGRKFVYCELCCLV